MDRLYASRCGVCAADQRQGIARFLLADRVREAILSRIHEGFNVREEIDPDLFRQTLETLDESVSQAFGLRTEWGKEDRAFIDELRHNNAVFAAFKAHREQNDLAALLLDNEGKPRSFDAFRKASEPVIGQYNVNWLQTEYTAAIRNARTARRFRAFQKDADLFPNLRWLKSRAAEPRFSHRQYYNTIRRIDDPWWSTHYPGCVWNCQCDIEQTTDPITHVGDTPAMPGKPSTRPGSEGEVRAPGLSQNPAISKSLFSQDHPYFTAAYPGAKEAVERMVGTANEHYTTIPTEHGQVRVHDGHGKGERQENIRVASYFANKYGYKIDLLDNPDGVKSADSYNQSLDRFEEYKVNRKENPTKSSIDNLLRKAKDQADHIVLWIDSDISLGDLRDAMIGRVIRSESIKTVTIVIGGKDCTYTREQIVKDGFKIKQADLK